MGGTFGIVHSWLVPKGVYNTLSIVLISLIAKSQLQYASTDNV
jgi:hypothetical protein